jgi:FkbM family methyltransferase
MYRDQNPQIYVFEIVGSFILHLRERFYNNQDVQILDFGLGGADKRVEFSVSSIATSIFSNSASAATESGQIKDVVGFLEENSIRQIDLLKMNIEGGEYELLERLVSSGAVAFCKNIQIQFHNYGEWSILKRDRLKEELRKTHVCTYDFEWTFENWKLKELS